MWRKREPSQRKEGRRENKLFKWKKVKKTEKRKSEREQEDRC